MGAFIMSESISEEQYRQLIDVIESYPTADDIIEIKELVASRNINAKNWNNNTSLMIAACGGYSKIVKMLIDFGADINCKDKQGGSALTSAYDYDENVDIVQMLINAGADVNAIDEFGLTPLMSAVDKGYRKIIVILLDAKADTDIKDEDGNTAFMVAIDNEDVDIIEFLRSLGVTR